MEIVILKDFPINIEFEQIRNALHIEDEDEIAQAENLWNEAKGIAKPKTIYRVAHVDEIRDDGAVIDGIFLKSRILAVNFKGKHLVFPYVSTCGLEIEEWSRSIEDPYYAYCADAMKEIMIAPTISHFVSHIVERFGMVEACCMNPGSLEDWPIFEQKKLFELIGNVKDSVGVTLKPSFLMTPIKSVSGIYFESNDGTYINCALCPREKCSNRRAKYDMSLYDIKYS